MLSILRWLFDSCVGCPGPDSSWPPLLAGSFYAANLTIGIAQFSIPLLVILHWQYRRDGVSPWHFWSVMMFLPIMALSRLVRIFDVYGPFYHLIVVLDVATAVLSVYSVSRLRRLILHILKLPSREDLHALKDQLQREAMERAIREVEILKTKDVLRAKLAEAEDRVVQLTEERASSDWWRSRKQTLVELHGMLDEIGVRDVP